MRPLTTLAGFTGSNRDLDARLLPATVGVSASNAVPGRGDLRPLFAPLTVATVPASPQRKTIWRMGRDVPNDAQYWLGWSAHVSVALGFDGSDTTERTYFTGDGTPKWTDNTIALGSAPYPQAARELAVPAPITKMSVAETTAGTGTESACYYVHTFVNDIGWESAPSPVSDAIMSKPGAINALTGLEAAPAGAYGITARRIYRTQADTSNTADFYFLREIPIASTSTTDDARGLGDALPTVGWIPLPSNAKGFIALWNGMYAAGSGKTLHITPAGIPYAAPVRYDIELNSTFVANAKWEQNLLVLTTGKPVLVQGQDPEGMGDSALALVHPCASAAGVAEVDGGVVWPSNEGLAYAGNRGQILLTEGVLSPRQWKALVPSSMVGGRYGRLYVGSYDDGAGRKGFIFDPSNPGGGITWLTSGFDACHYDELADVLYVLEGGNVRKFDGSDVALVAGFTSKIFKQTSPLNFGYCKVVAAGYPVTVSIASDSRDPVTGVVTMVNRITRVVPNGDAFTLPSGFSSEDWQVTVSTAHRVVAVHLAVSSEDLKAAR